ncbi:MAG: Uma2 family endonuclease [Gemmataceae bacterium]|nr:Uma2 family endonuclease [Gemmataceae bacterium]
MSTRNPTTRPATGRGIPPLESGDRLTRTEFERRYEAMPDVKKAELIEGEVYMGSPVSHGYHGEPHFDVITWLGAYKVGTPGTSGGDNSTVRLDPDNEPQPDVLLFVLPDYGGRVRLTKKHRYIRRAPDLVVEVAASSASIDLGNKLTAYRRNKVSEYLVWRVYDDAVDWFVNRAGRFDPLAPDPADGLLKSAAFPGLWLDPAALIGGDMPAVMAALNRGLASPEHAAFVQLLASRRTTP